MGVVISLRLRRTRRTTDWLGLSAVFLIGPGLNLAQTSLWLSCAMSLAALDIEKYVDESGNVVEPEIRYLDGMIRYAFVAHTLFELLTETSFSHPAPFKCAIKPRSGKAAALAASVEL